MKIPPHCRGRRSLLRNVVETADYARPVDHPRLRSKPAQKSSRTFSPADRSITGSNTVSLDFLPGGYRLQSQAITGVGNWTDSAILNQLVRTILIRYDGIGVGYLHQARTDVG